MNWKPVIVITVLAGAGYGLYRYFKKQQKLLDEYTAKPIAFSIVKWTNDEAIVNFTIRLTNKSDLEATINKIYSDVYLNEIYVGQVNDTNSNIVPARGISDIKASFTFSPKVILANIVDLALGSLQLRNMNYRLKGYVIAKSNIIQVSVPFEDKGKLSDLL